MALIGNCSFSTFSEHATETVTETVTLPDGTIETSVSPVMVETSTDYTNVYLSIKQVDNFNVPCTACGDSGTPSFNKIFTYQYAAYTSYSDKVADQENFLFWNTAQLMSYDHNQNLYAQIYAEIKNITGLTNLIND